MPSAKKVTWAELRVGITASVAVVLVGILIYLLTGKRNFFAHDVMLYTYMQDAAAVAVGAPVRINGILAGRIDKVGLSGPQERDPRKTIRIDMAVEEKYLEQIPDDSTTAISAENLLGAKFINIKRGKSLNAVKAGATLGNEETHEIEEVMSSFFPLLTSAQQILKRVDKIVETVETGKGSIGKLLVDEEIYNRFNKLLVEVQKSAEALNSGKGTVGKLLYDDSLYQEFRAPVQRIDKILEKIEQGEGTAGKLLRDPAVYNELQKNLVVMRALLEDLQAGKGTAGKLLKSDELHQQVTGLIQRMDVTMDKLNSGQGTLGQLLVNPQLYQTLDSTTREVQGLMKDFRSNPKKFLRIKLGLF